MGGTPVNNSAGKATKLPPPATALIPPPRAPAKNRKMAVCRFKRKFYHECGWSPKRAGCLLPQKRVESLKGPARAQVDSSLSHFLTTSADPYMNGGEPDPFHH